MTAASPPAVRGVEDRGVTTIADRVVARIASYAADGVEDVSGVDRKVLGVHVGGRRPARAEVAVDGSHVRARIQMTVAYPAPVREVTREVRDRVRHQVERMTGMTVRRVDIDVAAFDRGGGR